MTWAEILKAAVMVGVDLLRDHVTERREQRNPGLRYKDVKIQNDAAHRAGHEMEPDKK